MPARADDPRREKAIAMRRAGLSTRQIADAFGFRSTGGSIAVWLKDIPPPEWTRRPNAKDDLREVAVAMRRDGKSYREIAEVVPVSKSTLSLWLRDIELTEDQRAVLQENIARSNTARAQGARRSNELRRAKVVADARAQIPEEIAESELFVAGVVAYWAEGSKHKPWNPSARVRFTNSDPDMIDLFMRWLRLVGVEPERCTFTVAIHENADIEAAHQFWAERVGVPAQTFSKPNLKKHNPRTVRHNTGNDYRGCLVVAVRRSTDLYRQILGWWQGIVASADL